MEEVKLLSLDGDCFEDMKADFDSILMQTIGTMAAKGADDGSVTLKLGIQFERSCDGKTFKPIFKHDVSSAVSIKDKISGVMTGDYEMQWDSDKNSYVLHFADDGQASMF